MTKLLIRLFIKNSADTKNALVRAKYGTLAGAVGITTNLIIATVKLIIGVISGSIAVTADAMNNLSDAGSSLITLVGFKLSGRPADREHPYGHARYEYITGLIVSMLVTMIGGTFLIDSVKKIISGETAFFEWSMIIILSISIAVKLWQCLFYKKLGKMISSESLFASASDSRNDCIMTGVVLIGAIINKLSNLSLDGYLGAIVAVFILISGIKLVFETADPLIGKAPEKSTVDGLKDKILSYNGVIGLHDMIIHSYGANRIFASVHVEVPAEEDVMICHDIIDNIEEDVYNETGIFLVIHADPVTTGDERIDSMKKTLSEIVESLPVKCTYHDFRVVFGPSHDNVLFDIVVPYEKTLIDEDVIKTISDKFKEIYPKSIVKIRIDRDYSGII